MLLHQSPDTDLSRHANVTGIWYSIRMLLNGNDLSELAWPVARLDELLELVANRTGLGLEPRDAESLSPQFFQPDFATLGPWLEMAAQRSGLEAEPITSSLIEVDEMVRRAGPAILLLPPDRESLGASPHFLAMLGNRRRLVGRVYRVSLLGPDLRVHWVQPEVVRDAMCEPLVAPGLAAVDQLLAEAGVAETRRDHARRALLNEQLGAHQIEVGWLLRPSPRVSLWRQARQVRLWQPLLMLLGAALIQQVLLVVTWWIIGQGALSGHFEWVWLLAWALLLFTAIPFQLLVAWSQSQFAYAGGALIKQRLLYGALKLEPDDIRHEGMGQFLGRVMESEAVELLALNGGLLILVSLIQLGTASWVLAQATSGWPLLGLMWLWVAFIVAYGWYYYRHSHAWVETYRRMTNDLVEGMVGHRTRLAQEDPGHWHADEDRELARYVELSVRRDRIGGGLINLPASWLVVGLVGLAYAFVPGTASIEQLAITLGGVLLAQQALYTLTNGVEQGVQMGLSWQQVQPIFQAADLQVDVPAGPYFLSLGPSRKAEGKDVASPGQNGRDDQVPLLLAKDLNYRYRQGGRQVLQDCSLQIDPGDRLLLEGPSGGGKTTLAAVMSGLRQPESGLLLLWGYDQPSLGSEIWRRRLAVAPQFHENHIFTETFGFNLLLGRRWPPTAEDTQLAEIICRELGLGDLLERMPSGWQQMVGESGWQLSHGERSRVFIARALLQEADLMILDESFGALDPENLERALRCTLKWAPTLLVIAHP